MHPRNKHKNGYDINALVQCLPELKKFIIPTPAKKQSIDFANADAVLCLNKALLKLDYNINFWQLDKEFLCPPVPGRADYIHAIADLLSADINNKSPKGDHITGVDIGTGANLIYPLLGHTEYRWQFKASDVNPKAIANAQLIAKENNLPIHLYHQPNKAYIFNGLLKAKDYVHFSMCNPPFHNSQKEAEMGTQRKWQNLGKSPKGALNFGGHAPELWCEGGELRFIKTIIRESKSFAHQCGWFTSLVSKKDNLRDLKKALKKAEAKEVKVIKMQQGNKSSRFIAWSFITKEDRAQKLSK